jgi:hypothetical protein
MYAPPILGRMASQRASEVRSAAAHRYAAPRVPRATVRHRAGRTLIELGLRVAGPGSAH